MTDNIKRTFVIQYWYPGGWTDVNDGTSDYYMPEDQRKAFTSIRQAKNWCVSYHHPKRYGAHFEPSRWRAVEREEKFFPLVEGPI